MPLDSEILKVIRGEFSKLRIPSSRDKCYKDECTVSFDSPYSDEGLFVNMITLQGFGSSYWRDDAMKTGTKLYLQQIWTQIPKAKASNIDAPTKLAIGTPNGFNVAESAYELTKEHTLVVLMPSGEVARIPLPSLDIPEFVSNVADAIISHDGMKSKMQVDTWTADGDIKESKYAADLIQLDPCGKKISSDPKSWACEMSGAKENLWLNLSTGYIGGGRKNWDGTGGSGAALIHYEQTGKRYPLCVKLGTITAHGADIWSYAGDEDCLVKDSKLASHLSHWGIDIQSMEKTDRTMAELEVDLNMKYDWAKMMEGGTEMQPLSGAGLVGLRNIGSSCYLNSVIQAFVAVPLVQQRYLNKRSEIVASCTTAPSDDLAVQLAKLVDALLTDKYCQPLSTNESKIVMADGEAATDASTLEKYVVAPRMLKHLIGKGHPEFSGGRQQDAAEYFQYFLDQLTRAERTALPRFMPTGTLPTSSIFEYFVQNKIKCLVTQQVRLMNIEQSNMMELRIPLDAATNRAYVDGCEQEMKRAKLENRNDTTADREVPKLLVPFEACLATYFADSTIEYANPSLEGASSPCISNTRMRSLPDYLMVKLGRYTLGENWVQKKIDARVPVPETLDLSMYARDGIHATEVEMPNPENNSAQSPPSETTSAATTTPVADPDIVAQIMSMGFSENGASRAALATGNSSADMALNWVFEHMEDRDFNDPPQVNTASNAASVSGTISTELIETLMNYGFTQIQCTAALTATDSNLERAADWLFSHSDVASITEETVAQLNDSRSGGGAAVTHTSNTIDPRVPDFGASGQGKYELVSIISHIGRSTDHGHYVCHRKQDGRWVLFNDEKVALSANPPLEHGYMYLFRKL